MRGYRYIPDALIDVFDGKAGRTISGPSDPIDDEGGEARHAVVTSLQILTLTAELLAMDLRDGGRTLEQVQARSGALRHAVEQITRVARRIPAAELTRNAGDRVSFVDTEPVRTIRAFVGFIIDHAERPDIERDVLAEYVDWLHCQAAELIASIDKPTTQ